MLINLRVTIFVVGKSMVSKISSSENYKIEVRIEDRTKGLTFRLDLWSR